MDQYSLIISFVFPVLSAIFWHWVQGLNKKIEDERCERKRIEVELHNFIMLNMREYQTKSDGAEQYRMLRDEIKELRKEIKSLMERR